MPDITPSVTRKELEQLPFFVPGNINLTALKALDNYKNKFTLLSNIADFFDTESPEQDFVDIHAMNLNTLRTRRSTKGYLIVEFRLDEIFTPDELSGLHPEISERALQVNERVKSINNLGIDESDIRLMCDKWREIDAIIRTPYDKFDPLAA